MEALPRRLSLMITVVSIALVAAACGRATDDQINQALGITPTATLSAEQIASATAAASATSAARLLAVSSPGAVALGDVQQGERQFETWCIGCHGPGGVGPEILSPGSPGSAVTADSLLPLVRDGEGHTPPGPYKTTEITNKQITDIAAYMQNSAGG
jgi:mono/diheme cytochrome c family protein